MNENSTAVEMVSNTPALVVGSTWFWQDDAGNWQTVEVVDCQPRGWGFACIEWHDNGTRYAKSVPVLSLMDLDTYLDQDTDYSAFEFAGLAD